VHVLGGDVFDAVHETGVERPVAGGDGFVELRGDSERPIAPKGLLRLELALCASHLVAGYAVVLDLLENLFQGFFDLVVRALRRQEGKERKEPRVAQARAHRHDLGGEALVGETVIAAAALPAGENAREHAEGVGVLGKPRWGLVAHQEGAELALLAHGHAPLAALLGLARGLGFAVGVGSCLGAAVDGAEVLGDEIERLGALHVADDRGRGVLRPVEAVVEAAQVLGACRLDVRPPADGGVVVAVRGEGRRPDGMKQVAEGIVLPLVVLVEDDGALALYVLGPQEQAAHPVGLDLDGLRQVFLRQQLVVVGAVEPRGGVHPRPHPLQGVKDGRALPRVEALGALEHEMFEHVRGPGQPGALVAAAHAIGQHEAGDRRGGLRHNEHLEAVGIQAVLLDAAGFFDEREGIGRDGFRPGCRRGNGAFHAFAGTACLVNYSTV
jgi:hypothetical protein